MQLHGDDEGEAFNTLFPCLSPPVQKLEWVAMSGVATISTDETTIGQDRFVCDGGAQPPDRRAPRRAYKAPEGFDRSRNRNARIVAERDRGCSPRRRRLALDRTRRKLGAVRGRRFVGCLEVYFGTQPSNVRGRVGLSPTRARFEPLAARSKSCAPSINNLTCWFCDSAAISGDATIRAPRWLATIAIAAALASARARSLGSYRPRAVAALVNNRGERLTIEMLAGRHFSRMTSWTFSRPEGVCPGALLRLVPSLALKLWAWE